MKYQTVNGEVYDLEKLTSEERVFFDRIWKDYNLDNHNCPERYTQKRDWIGFINFYGLPLQCLIERESSDIPFALHPLSVIQIDLAVRMGVRNGQLEGEVSNPLED